MHPRMGNATLPQLAFPGEGNTIFPLDKSHLGQYSCKKKKKKKRERKKDKKEEEVKTVKVNYLFGALSPKNHRGLHQG